MPDLLRTNNTKIPSQRGAWSAQRKTPETWIAISVEPPLSCEELRDVPELPQGDPFEVFRPPEPHVGERMGRSGKLATFIMYKESCLPDPDAQQHYRKLVQRKFPGKTVGTWFVVFESASAGPSSFMSYSD